MFVFGQTKKIISGVVRDGSGNAIAGVSVTVKGARSGISTDVEGNFKIAVPSSNSTLVFSSVGYQTKEVETGADAFISVSLTNSTGTLSNVVVSGALGIKKQNKNLGYSATSVGGSEIASTNTVNPIAGLEGKVAGVEVNVVSSSGIQTSPYIQIRGASVLGNGTYPANNQPIFVIDGNVLQNNISGPDATDAGSQLKNLNPDDYESLTVLKGAAATALYGSRGINGAIVITTKSGKAGKGLGIELISTYSKNDIYAPFMALQNEYGMGDYNREGAFNPDGTQDYTNYSFGPKFDGTLHPTVYGITGDSARVPYVAQPNNWKTFFQQGDYINNGIAVSGGSDKSTYRFGYSNNHSNGDLPKNGLDRNAIDIKINGQLNKVFSAEVGVNYANTKTYNYYNQSRYAWPGGGNLGFDVYYMPRNTDFATWHATYRNPDNSIKPNNFGFVTNGFAILDKNNYTNTENSLLSYVRIKAQVNDWIDLSGQANMNFQKSNQVTKNYGNNQYNEGGQYAVGGSNSTGYNLLFSAHATRKAMHDNLGIDIRLLNEIYGNEFGESFYASTDGGLKVPNQFFLANSVNPMVSGNDINYNPSYPSQLTIGVAADINLNYKKYLNVEFTGRNDWISTLTYPIGVPGKNNNSVFYPSVNVAYTFYDQFRDKMPSWLYDGRLRGSVAWVGNAGVAQLILPEMDTALALLFTTLLVIPFLLQPLSMVRFCPITI